MGHVGSKVRSLGQILLKKNLVYTLKRHIFSPIIMKLGQNVCLDVILDEFENGSFRVENKVTRSYLRKTLLINALPHNPESSGERLQGHHGPLVL